MKKIEKVKFEVTLAALRKEGACVDGYNKVVRMLQGKPFDDAERSDYIRFAHKEPINLLSILESNGVDDCLWALRAVDHPDRDRISRYIACDCAEAVLYIAERDASNRGRSRNAIEVGRRFANGNATSGELAAAWAAAWAARAAAWDAAWAAARAAAGDAACDAAWAAAGDARAAAWAAAGDAAWAAARAAAGDAAWAAAGDAAWDVAWAARAAAGDAAWDVAWAARAAAGDAAGDAQAKIIREYLQ